MWMRLCSSSASSRKLLLASGTALIPAMIAWMKNGEKVSLTPWRSNSPRSRSRAVTTRVMSASMTVVTCGAAWTLAVMWWAMLRRMDDSGTISTSSRTAGLSPSGAAMWAMTSFLVMRPLAPAPVTWARSTPCSSARRATAGEMKHPERSGAVGCAVEGPDDGTGCAAACASTSSLVMRPPGPVPVSVARST